MKEIKLNKIRSKLNQNKVALVDDEDFEELDKYFFHLDNYGYAVPEEAYKAYCEACTKYHKDLAHY